MKLFGILLVVGFSAANFWWNAIDGRNYVGVNTATVVAVFAGILLTRRDKDLKLKTRYAEIESYEKQAESKVEAITKLEELAKNQSATINLIAREANEAKKMSEQAEGELTTLNEKIKEAISTLTKLESTSKFMDTLIAAQTDGAEAFDTLRIWADDKDNPFHEKAKQAWNKIFADHSSRFAPGFLQNGIDRSGCSFTELRNIYEETVPDFRPALLNDIWQRKFEPRVDRMEFFIHVISTDKSMRAREFAGRFFLEDAGRPKIAPIDGPRITKWWEQHRHEFEEGIAPPEGTPA